METKILRRFFGLADFLDEQKFLEEQHRQGWKFKSYSYMTKYVFEKCEPEEYIYRLDYNENNQDEEAYIQIFSDCGWEYIMKFQTWYYFRKKKSTLNIQDNEIFSDNDSKIDMIKKVMWRQTFIVIPMLFFLGYFLSFINWQNDAVFRTIMIVYTLIMTFLLTISVRNVIKLNKLIHELTHPLDE